ncbi:MAG: hypothetical protein IPK15_05190, partial [Verrucomicrobia bacterium]|nr:hypothetical protein [Verrucomicrobiota bacterium]
MNSASGGPLSELSGAVELVAGQRHGKLRAGRRRRRRHGRGRRLPSHETDQRHHPWHWRAEPRHDGLPGWRQRGDHPTEPSDLSLPANAFATFTVGAAGASPLCGGGVAYQWYRDGVAIPGANSSSLTV